MGECIYVLTICALTVLLHRMSCSYLDELQIVHFAQAIVTTGQTNDSDVVVVGTEKDVSMVRCIQQCKRKKSCNFVNYRFLVHLCYNVRVSPGVQPTIAEDTGCMYSNMSESNTPTPSACSACSYDEQCDLSTTPASCEIKGCGPPPYVKAQVINGNLYAVHNQLVYTDTLTNARVTYTCSPNGTWYISQVVEPPITTSTSTTTTTSTSTSTSTTTTTTPAPGGVVSTGWIPRPSSSSSYKVVTTPADWQTAVVTFSTGKGDYCDTEGYLAVIYHSSEESFVAGLLNDAGVTSYWAGATDADTETTWVWVLTSLAWSYNNFGSASGHAGWDSSKNCLLITPSNTATWSADVCSTRHSYVCEKLS